MRLDFPAMTFSPAASVWSENGQVAEWDLSQIEYALEKGILPVVHGDVIFRQSKRRDDPIHRGIV